MSGPAYVTCPRCSEVMPEDEIHSCTPSEQAERGDNACSNCGHAKSAHADNRCYVGMTDSGAPAFDGPRAVPRCNCDIFQVAAPAPTSERAERIVDAELQRLIDELVATTYDCGSAHAMPRSADMEAAEDALQEYIALRTGVTGREAHESFRRECRRAFVAAVLREMGL